MGGPDDDTGPPEVSLASAEDELMDPMPLVMELRLLCEPTAGGVGPGPARLSSEGEVTCELLDIEPRELVFVSTAGGRQ